MKSSKHQQHNSDKQQDNANKQTPKAHKQGHVQTSKNDPLHGVRLDRILDELTQRYSWQQLANKIAINCFKSNPSIKSSLAFLRKTPWARRKVETLWVWTFVDANYQPPASKAGTSNQSAKATKHSAKPGKSSPQQSTFLDNDFNPWLKNRS